MNRITSVDALQRAIVELDIRRQEQEQELSDHFMIIYEGLKPVNFMRSSLRAIAESPDVRHQMVNAAIAMVSGYVSRKLVVRSQSGPLTRVLGTVLQLGITSLIGLKGDAIKAGAFQILRGLLANRNGNGSR